MAHPTQGVSRSYQHTKSIPVNWDGRVILGDTGKLDLSFLPTADVDVSISDAAVEGGSPLPANFVAVIGVKSVTKSSGAADPGGAVAGVSLSGGSQRVYAKVATAPGAGNSVTVRVLCLVSQ